MKNNFSIRVMKQEEIQVAIDWAANEGWNPGLDDAKSYYIADDKGFLVGLLDDEPIAVISAIRYDDTFGFLGFYIVKPEYRGKGYGIQIWDAAINHLKGLNIGLDGVVEQQKNYKKSGFKFAYSNIRYEGVFDGEANEVNEVRNLKNISFDIVDKYDRQFFPARRSEFIQTWINNPNCKSLGLIMDNEIIAYGVIRKCMEGYKIGPLYAENPEFAKRVFVALISKLKSGDKYFLDIPEPNAAAVNLVNKFNMNKVFETARMYTGDDPELPVNRIYGVTSFEIG